MTPTPPMISAWWTARYHWGIAVFLSKHASILSSYAAWGTPHFAWNHAAAFLIYSLCSLSIKISITTHCLLRTRFYTSIYAGSILPETPVLLLYILAFRKTLLHEPERQETVYLLLMQSLAFRIPGQASDPETDHGRLFGLQLFPEHKSFSPGPNKSGRFQPELLR